MQICYELANKGKMNDEIAEILKIEKQQVSNLICQWRKRHNLPAPNRKKHPKSANYGASGEALWAKEKREQNAKEAVKRDDGIIQCPTRYCYGYGLK